MISGNTVSYKISDFLTKSENDIVGELNDPSLQIQAWRNQIKSLQKSLSNKEGQILFEYGITGLSKVCDVILLLSGKIFVLEYKNGSNEYYLADRNQTLCYALRLKYFHSNSNDKDIIPILIATEAENIQDPHKKTDDGVYHLVLCNDAQLNSILDSYCNGTEMQYQSWYHEWENGIFKATPGIIKAAKDIWNKQHVDGLVDDNFNIKSTQIRLEAEKNIFNIIKSTKENKRKALIFVTGVPGAGKTLVGLKVSVGAQEYGASLLSGNGPLVEVLSTALKNNLDLQQENLKKEDREALKSHKGNTKSLDNLKETIAVDSIIRGVYGYKSEIIERLNYNVSPDLRNKPGFKFSMKERMQPCSQHVIIYDEAQRAWSLTKMRQPGRAKKNWQDSNWAFSEPALLLWDMDQLDWGVFICLVGGGQEINEGESGINEWLRTLVEDSDKVDFNNWDVFMAPNLNSSEYQLIDGNNLSISDYINKIAISKPTLLHYDTTLHLTECQRSPLATGLSNFINKLVDGEATADDYAKISHGYTISLTRNVETAKKFLRERQKQLKPLVTDDYVDNSTSVIADDPQNHILRTGILMSSNGLRLRPLGFEIKKVADYLKKTPSWFLDTKEDNVDSSDFLEVALSEFFVQGLEIDLSCVIWDGDFRFDPDTRKWRFFKFNKKSWSEKKEVPETGRTIDSINNKKESNVKTRITQAYMRNAYRVLLTRARLGMVICVPEGSNEDTTRAPEFYDTTYQYLKSLGLKVLKE